MGDNITGTGSLKQYKRRPDAAITAVKLDLDTDGFTFRKWGGEQHCKAGDWLVDNKGEVYTIDAESFARTYSEVSPGRYIKTAPVWAERAPEAGSISTKEGKTQYEAGDYLVYNEADRCDGYAMSPERFGELYEPAD